MLSRTSIAEYGAADVMSGGRAMPFQWIVAQEGSRQTYAVPLSFHRLNRLRLMYTDIWCRRARTLLKHGTKGTRALATRYQREIPTERVVSFNYGAILARTRYHFKRNHLTPEQQGDEFIRFGRWFAEEIERHVARVELEPKRDLFFGFNTNCLEVVEHLRGRGIFTIVDQVDPGRSEEELVLEEAERWPGWAPSSGRLPASYWDRLQAEWQLANLVLVNSDWSCEALVRQGVPARKIIVVPLAIDLSHEHPKTPIAANGPLKVLWLGSVILRKGIQYLVEAAQLLRGRQVEFLIAGPCGIAESAVRSFPQTIRMLGRITRDQLGEIYRQAHVFVLPTISDGFAVTQLEAMAHGLPVIATYNCGRVVTDGHDGILIPARNSEALAEALETLDSDRDLLKAMSINALQTVRSYDLPSNARQIEERVLERFPTFAPRNSFQPSRP